MKLEGYPLIITPNLEKSVSKVTIFCPKKTSNPLKIALKNKYFLNYDKENKILSFYLIEKKSDTLYWMHLFLAYVLSPLQKKCWLIANPRLLPKEEVSIDLTPDLFRSKKTLHQEIVKDLNALKRDSLKQEVAYKTSTNQRLRKQRSAIIPACILSVITITIVAYNIGSTFPAYTSVISMVAIIITLAIIMIAPCFRSMLKEKIKSTFNTKIPPHPVSNLNMKAIQTEVSELMSAEISDSDSNEEKALSKC